MMLKRGGAVAAGSAACLLLAVSLAPAAPAAMHDAGTWDLSFEKGNRRCRLFLRAEPHGSGFALALPAGCHKAFPLLAGATSWVPGEGEGVSFVSDAGAAVVAFAPNGSAGLVATVGEAGDSYVLTPISPALQEALRTAGTPPAVTAPAETTAAAPDAEGGVMVDTRAAPRTKTAKAQHAPAPTLPPTTVAAVAGNYAVLRQDRDTGCMVTLEPGARARLAPACRDQGIVIFDPAGWQLLRGNELVLKARKGHTTALSRHDEATWTNAPAHGTALVLKRL